MPYQGKIMFTYKIPAMLIGEFVLVSNPITTGV